MKGLGTLVLAGLGLLALTAPPPAAAQASPGPTDIEALKKTAVKVYLDCGSCDIEYIKDKITFVNYVRDRKEAQVHVLITTQYTGSGGREYTLTFIGQNGFEDVKDVQKYFTGPTDTDDEVRIGLVKALKLGLMSYVGRTPIVGRIAVNYSAPPAAGSGQDPWNFWVFSLASSGRLSGQKTYKNSRFGGDFSANRVTEQTKLQLSVGYRSSREEVRIEEEDRTASGLSESWEGNGLFVKSLGEHWSAGAYLETSSSYYENIRFSLALAPAVEYNFFPYAQSTRRQLRLLYRLAWNPVAYRETTQYGQTKETLWTQSLSLTLELRERWGTASVSVSGVNYLNHFSKGHIGTFGSLTLNVYKGLNVFVFGSWSLIKDQLSLRLREPTSDEVYLRLVELRTNSNAFFMFGVQFTFGSIYTNVINPRFGSHTGGMSIHID